MPHPHFQKGAQRMSRFLRLLALLTITAAILAACSNRAKEEEAKQNQINQIRAQSREMQAGIDDLRRQLQATAEQLRQEHAATEKRLTDMVTAADNLSTQVTGVATSVNTLDQTQSRADGRRWPWPVTVLLILVIIIVAYLLYKGMTRDGGEEDEMVDEGFVEENDLGTVRYPGEKRGPDAK
jgi:hypothetical protein